MKLLTKRLKHTRAAQFSRFENASRVPHQEWAISVALRSWEETRIAVSARSLLSAPLVVASSACLLSESVAAFDALVRRSRQVERILLASLVSSFAVFSFLAPPVACHSKYVRL